MAAAIIPIITGLAPTIIDLIAGLVHKQAPVAEATLGAGTGPVKFADVFSYVVGALTKAATAGQIDKTLPSDDAIKLVIQSVVSSLKLQGLLTSETTPSAIAGTQSVTLKSGETLTVQVL